MYPTLHPSSCKRRPPRNDRAISPSPSAGVVPTTAVLPSAESDTPKMRDCSALGGRILNASGVSTHSRPGHVNTCTAPEWAPSQVAILQDDGIGRTHSHRVPAHRNGVPERLARPTPICRQLAGVGGRGPPTFRSPERIYRTRFVGFGDITIYGFGIFTVRPNDDELAADRYRMSEKGRPLRRQARSASPNPMSPTIPCRTW